MLWKRAVCPTQLQIAFGVEDEPSSLVDLIRQRPLVPGDYYALLPPRDDVHRVRTTSDVTSVSIHLLANDTGCVLRHTFDEQTGEARPFRSGYVNAECVETGGTS